MENKESYIILGENSILLYVAHFEIFSGGGYIFYNSEILSGSSESQE